MTELDREALYDKLFQKFEHHPLMQVDLIPAMEFLRNLNIKTGNMDILEGYNDSARIADAYKDLIRNRRRELPDEPRGVARGKLHGFDRQDSDDEQDQGGV